MSEIDVALVRSFHPLGGVKDSEIEAHLRSAKRRFLPFRFPSNEDRDEAVALQTIIYVAPLLFARGMQNIAQYEEVYSKLDDLKGFCAFYEERLEGILDKARGNAPLKGEASPLWRAV